MSTYEDQETLIYDDSYPAVEDVESELLRCTHLLATYEKQIQDSDTEREVMFNWIRLMSVAIEKIKASLISADP